MAAQRLEFLAWRVGIDPSRFVFIDETWVKTNMSRLYGWGPKNERLRCYVPHGHWNTTTFVGALRSTGLVAPLVIDGAMNGQIFRAYVEQQLVRELKPGDIVVMDNLPCHKVQGVAQAIRAVGAEVVYLPPYSPDLNPIEQVFSKVKNTIRKRQPRKKEELDALCGESLDWFPASECQNYIRHAGYLSQQAD